MGLSFAPGISDRNSGENSPNTVEMFTPTFSKTFPCMMDISPPPPGAPVWSVLSHVLSWNSLGFVVEVLDLLIASMASNDMQISSRSDLNHAVAANL